RKGTYLIEALRACLGQHPHVGEIRGKGFMCAIEFVKDRDTGMPFVPEEQVAAAIHAEAQARGLFSRVRGDVFVLAPPFVTPDDLLDRIAAVLASATKVALRRRILLAVWFPVEARWTCEVNYARLVSWRQ